MIHPVQMLSIFHAPFCCWGEVKSTQALSEETNPPGLPGGDVGTAETSPRVREGGVSEVMGVTQNNLISFLAAF